MAASLCIADLLAIPLHHTDHDNREHERGNQKQERLKFVDHLKSPFWLRNGNLRFALSSILKLGSSYLDRVANFFLIRSG
jgi:hypothetical protein